ncbi:MAG: ferritin family protein [Planctomycetes bacterium]|nr:ferritin family protein [Planctomycetota bacterium]
MLSFTADEVYEMAQVLERTGVQFYRRTAELAADGPLRQMLLSLADMEQNHLQVFSDLRRQLPAEGRRQGDPVPPEDVDEHRHYVRALVESHTFGAVDEAWFASPAARTPEDVLRRAAALEKDAIVFFLELQELVPLRQGRQEIERILREELQHLRILNARMHARSR